MLSKEDIQVIIKELNKIEEEGLNFDIKIENININEKNGKDIDTIAFIDSSYVTDVIGGFTYIFAKATAVYKNEKFFENYFLILPGSFFKFAKKNEKIPIREFADLLAKNLEYKLANKFEYSILDGSLVSDYILLSKYFSSETDNEKMNEIIYEFKNNFLSSSKNKLLSIAKRIAESDYIMEKTKDILLLQKIFDKNIFYTDIKRIDLGNDNIISILFKSVKIMYYRAKYSDRIYRLESFENVEDEEIYGIIKRYIINRGYPYELYMAHKLCKITNEDKKVIEYYIRKKIGFDKTLPTITD